MKLYERLLRFYAVEPKRIPRLYRTCPREYYRASTIWRYINTIIGLAHALFIAYFALIGIPALAFYNIASVASFAASVMLLRYGFFIQALFIGLPEVIVHAALCTHFVGWGAGFHYFIILIPIVLFINPFVKDILQYALYAFWFIVTVSAVVLLKLYSDFHEPVFVLTDATMLVTHIINAIFAALFLSVIALYFSLYVKRSEVSLEAARERSDHLLHNILPPPIADRLKQSEKTIADRFEQASVLFLDIVDFTVLSSRFAAGEIVELLNSMFTEFDSICETHGIEKIKTIGDAYMAAAGIPERAGDHAARCARAAIDMLAYLRSARTGEGTELAARVGICSGPVVAGVIGRHKFIYDLWGDTVNTASRMESHGRPGHIQVAESTYALLEDSYEFEYRGRVAIKGKGEMSTWYLKEPL